MGCGIVKRCWSEYRAPLKVPFFFPPKREARWNSLRNTRRENTDQVYRATTFSIAKINLQNSVNFRPDDARSSRWTSRFIVRMNFSNNPIELAFYANEFIDTPVTDAEIREQIGDIRRWNCRTFLGRNESSLVRILRVSISGMQSGRSEYPRAVISEPDGAVLGAWSWREIVKAGHRARVFI